MLMCLYVHMLCWSRAHICTCFDYHMLTFQLDLMITCFYVHMLWWSYVPMSTWFDENISTFMYALILIRSDTFKICMLQCSQALLMTCFYVLTYFNDRMLLCLHAFIITCPLTNIPSCSYAWTLWCLPAPMFKCFDYSIHTCIDIHMFDIHTHKHTFGWWNVYWLEG